MNGDNHYLNRVVNTKNDSLISVIIPIYNVSNELSRCLDSILSNTYKSLELICVNDGSTDNCLEILYKYAEIDNRVKVIDQKNAGVAEARNTGLRHAVGEYVSFIDSDDWIHPQYFECLLKALINTSADVAVCESKEVFGLEPYPIVNLKHTDIRILSYDDIKRNYTVRHRVWARLYRRTMVMNHWFPEDVWIADDTVFNLDVLSHKKDLKVVFLEPASVPPLYYYYMREGSITHSTTLNSIDQTRWFFRHKLDFESEKTGNEWLLLEHIIKMALAARYYNDYGKRDRGIKKEINSYLRTLIPKLKQSKYAPRKDKLILSVMATYPALYRSFRLRDDPSLRAWERNQKQEEE